MSEPYNDPLEPFLKEAEANGLWIHTPYQDLWFRPDELRQLRQQGRFRWGIENWHLRSPLDKLKQLKDAFESSKRELEQFEAQLKEPK